MVPEPSDEAEEADEGDPVREGAGRQLPVRRWSRRSGAQPSVS